jgi:Pyrimidine dimer DNA glycosylase
LNIFFVDSDPVKAAQALVDRHCVKMILESAQLLSTAHRYVDGKMLVAQNENGRKTKRWYLDDAREPVLYKATHINHPSNVWTRTAVENYLWLVEHFAALLDEYTHRYGKKHKTGELLYMLQSPPHGVRDFDMTEMPSAMKDEYKISADPVINYRNYYKYGKAAMHKWTNREPPEWIQ